MASLGDKACVGFAAPVPGYAAAQWQALVRYLHLKREVAGGFGAIG